MWTFRRVRRNAADALRHLLVFWGEEARDGGGHGWPPLLLCRGRESVPLAGTP